MIKRVACRGLTVAGMAAWVAGLGVVALGGAAPQNAAVAQPRGASAAALPDPIDFNWHIRPILAENCFQCHGPDAKNRQANMRLDVAEEAYAERGAPARPRRPIVPGDADQSALLRTWISQGAKYKPHWAFITPTLPPVPAIAAAGEVNEIDRFALARLKRE